MLDRLTKAIAGDPNGNEPTWFSSKVGVKLTMSVDDVRDQLIWHWKALFSRAMCIRRVAVYRL